MDLDRINEILKSYQFFRRKQVDEAIFNRLASNWSEVSNLPKDLIEILQNECPLEIKAKTFETKDKKTVKAAIILSDNKEIETVLMRHKDNRNTVCVSCQVGCALNCAFCATGQQGFCRDLTSSEIILQVLYFARFLKKENAKITNVVFMGMGEPFLNYDNVMKAIYWLNDKDKFNLGSRQISISTSGIIEGINKLAKEPLQVNLAFSFHAVDNDLRTKLMPINQTNSLSKVLEAIGNYIEKTNRRVMIEYLMLENINDSENSALDLAKLLKKKLHRLFFVNLISYNATEKFQPSNPETIKKFKSILEKEGIVVVQRYRFGTDIKAACGQLALNRVKLKDK